MNLLRESNMQLREENKHNFEECQVLKSFSMKYFIFIFMHMPFFFKKKRE